MNTHVPLYIYYTDSVAFKLNVCMFKNLLSKLFIASLETLGGGGAFLVHPVFPLFLPL